MSDKIAFDRYIYLENGKRPVVFVRHIVSGFKKKTEDILFLRGDILRCEYRKTGKTMGDKFQYEYYKSEICRNDNRRIKNAETGVGE